MALFGIADLHLSLSAKKPMDIFTGWQNYVEKISQNWRKIVSENDTVVLAGDISWAMKLEETYEDFKFIHELPGNKLIIKGNHDYWWTTKNKMDNYLRENGFSDIKILHNNAFAVDNIAVCGTRGWMYNSETDEDLKIINREAGRLRSSISEALKMGKEPVVFLHYPPVYDNFVSQQIMDVLKEFDIKSCFFGHIHGAAASKKLVLGEFDGIKMNLIACDFLKFTPLLVVN